MKSPTMRDIRERLVSDLTISLWPDYGTAAGWTRNFTYEAAAKGNVPGAFQTGKLWRVATATARRTFGIDSVEVPHISSFANKAA